LEGKVVVYLLHIELLSQNHLLKWFLYIYTILKTSFNEIKKIELLYGAIMMGVINIMQLMGIELLDWKFRRLGYPTISTNEQCLHNEAMGSKKWKLRRLFGSKHSKETVVNSSKITPMKTLMCGSKGTATNKQED
jgi:hypothetical protein